jgi:hypothetical protein
MFEPLKDSGRCSNGAEARIAATAASSSGLSPELTSTIGALPRFPSF